MTTVIDTREYLIQYTENNGQTWRTAGGHGYRQQQQATTAAQNLAADKRNAGMRFRVIEVRQTWTVAAEIGQPAASVESEPAACPVHRVKLAPGAVEPKCPNEHGNVEYGVFGDEGSLVNYDCAYEAANHAAEFAAEDPDTEYTVRRVCNEHPDNAADTCEDCG